MNQNIILSGLNKDLWKEIHYCSIHEESNMLRIFLQDKHFSCHSGSCEIYDCAVKVPPSNALPYAFCKFLADHAPRTSTFWRMIAEHFEDFCQKKGPGTFYSYHYAGKYCPPLTEPQDVPNAYSFFNRLTCTEPYALHKLALTPLIRTTLAQETRMGVLVSRRDICITCSELLIHFFSTCFVYSQIASDPVSSVTRAPNDTSLKEFIFKYPPPTPGIAPAGTVPGTAPTAPTPQPPPPPQPPPVSSYLQAAKKNINKDVLKWLWL